MSAVIATVTTEPPRAGAGVVVRVAFPATGETVPLPLPDQGLFKGIARQAGSYLERLVGSVPRLNVPSDRAGEPLRLLLNAGRELVSGLTQDDPSRLRQLQQAFRRAWPQWQQPGWDDPSRPVPVVELHVGTVTLPLELLPVFDFGSPPAATNAADLARMAARFLGFSTVVRRILPAAMSQDHVLRNDPALPVQFLRHRRLPSATAEERFLAALDPHVRVDGPWPVAQDDDEVRRLLLGALLDGTALHSDAPGGPPVQIQHFACHCDTSTERYEDYRLTLSTRSGARRSITFAQLRSAYFDRFDDVPVDGVAPHRAVIVLNACASSRTSPLTATSFPRWFLNHGHRAFIGTETYVPDAVAAAFAESFYGRLLERRRPMGEAVVWARRDLLRDYRNPLGLLYVMYGDTDLTVEQARPGVYRSGATTRPG